MHEWLQVIMTVRNPNPSPVTESSLCVSLQGTLWHVYVRVHAPTYAHLRHIPSLCICASVSVTISYASDLDRSVIYIDIIVLTHTQLVSTGVQQPKMTKKDNLKLVALTDGHASTVRDGASVILGSHVRQEASRRSGLLAGLASTQGLAELPGHIQADDFHLWQAACVVDCDLTMRQLPKILQVRMRSYATAAAKLETSPPRS